VDGIQAAQDLNEKNSLQKRALELYRAGNLDALEREFARLSNLDNTLGLSESLTGAFQNRYADVKSEERRLTLIFILSFVLGSALVGADFVRSVGRITGS